MKKNSIKELLALLEEKPQKRTEQPEAESREAVEAPRGASPEERIGRALLDKLGDTGGISKDALADAIIAAWDEAEARSAKSGRASENEPSIGAAEELIRSIEGISPANASPFGEAASHTPMPIKSSASVSAPVDYEALTDKQFRQLKKQLQRAAAEGKRIRL